MLQYDLYQVCGQGEVQGMQVIQTTHGDGVDGEELGVAVEAG